jgi:hypothetical protein
LVLRKLLTAEQRYESDLNQREARVHFTPDPSRSLVINDSLICSQCKNCVFIDLEGNKKKWYENAEEIFPFLRPELTAHDLPNPRLLFLYQDCYNTLLIGRYNASIVMMGVLLEIIVKERIKLKLGEYFSKPFSPCLKKIERYKLMKQEHIFFSESLKIRSEIHINTPKKLIS